MPFGLCFYETHISPQALKSPCFRLRVFHPCTSALSAARMRWLRHLDYLRLLCCNPHHINRDPLSNFLYIQNPYRYVRRSRKVLYRQSSMLSRYPCPMRRLLLCRRTGYCPLRDSCSRTDAGYYPKGTASYTGRSRTHRGMCLTDNLFSRKNDSIQHFYP